MCASYQLKLNSNKNRSVFSLLVLCGVFLSNTGNTTAVTLGTPSAGSGPVVSFPSKPQSLPPEAPPEETWQEQEQMDETRSLVESAEQTLNHWLEEYRQKRHNEGEYSETSAWQTQYVRDLITRVSQDKILHAALLLPESRHLRNAFFNLLGEVQGRNSNAPTRLTNWETNRLSEAFMGKKVAMPSPFNSNIQKERELFLEFDEIATRLKLVEQSRFKDVQILKSEAMEWAFSKSLENFVDAIRQTKTQHSPTFVRRMIRKKGKIIRTIRVPTKGKVAVANRSLGLQPGSKEAIVNQAFCAEAQVKLIQLAAQAVNLAVDFKHVNSHLNPNMAVQLPQMFPNNSKSRSEVLNQIKSLSPGYYTLATPRRPGVPGHVIGLKISPESDTGKKEVWLINFNGTRSPVSVHEINQKSIVHEVRKNVIAAKVGVFVKENLI